VKNKLLSGFIWGVGFCFAAILSLKGIGYIESLFREDRIEFSHKVNSFEVLNNSHRIITSDNGISYLVITGEVKSKEFKELSSIEINAELRDSQGGFVDLCSYYRDFIEETTTVTFKIKCNDISTSDQFFNYKISIQGLSGKFI